MKQTIPFVLLRALTKRILYGDPLMAIATLNEYAATPAHLRAALIFKAEQRIKNETRFSACQAIFKRLVAGATYAELTQSDRALLNSVKVENTNAFVTAMRTRKVVTPRPQLLSDRASARGAIGMRFVASTFSMARRSNYSSGSANSRRNSRSRS
jgi:hypothetical protein